MIATIIATVVMIFSVLVIISKDREIKELEEICKEKQQKYERASVDIVTLLVMLTKLATSWKQYDEGHVKIIVQVPGEREYFAWKIEKETDEFFKHVDVLPKMVEYGFVRGNRREILNRISRKEIE